MRPRFGALTQVLAAVFLITGLGAAWAVLHAGDQVTHGHGSDRLILVALAISYVLVGIGLWTELLWAWWVGFALTFLTVGLSVPLGTPEGGWIPWSVLLVVFTITAVQGRQAEPGG